MARSRRPHAGGRLRPLCRSLVGAPARRTPTIAFTVEGRTPLQVSADLGNQGVAVWAGNYYAVELMTALGLEDRGGAVRAGVVCYTTDE